MASNPTQLEDLLSSMTDALLAYEGSDLDAIAQRYALPPHEIAGYTRLIRQLHAAMPGAQPSSRYVNSLRHDLIGAPQPSVVARVRHLPTRVQIAAGIVAVMGFVLLVRRRLTGESDAVAADNAEATAQ